MRDIQKCNTFARFVKR